MRKLVILAALLPCVAVAEPVFKHGGPCGDFPQKHLASDKNEDHLPPFLLNLNLSNGQQTEINKLLKSNKDKFPKPEGFHKEISALHRLSFSNDFSVDKVQAQINQSVAAHKELILQKAILDNEIFKLLNDEQKQKLLKDQDNIEKACVDGH